MDARCVGAAVLVGALLLWPSGAFAEPQVTPSPAASASPAAEHPRDGGIISGKITSIDYQRSMISVNRIQITVMPSTQIQGSDPAYHAITDLKAGMAVDVYTSQIGGKFIAQIISLK